MAAEDSEPTIEQSGEQPGEHPGGPPSETQPTENAAGPENVSSGAVEPDQEATEEATEEAESRSGPQALGQVERPPADQFQGKRRLLLLPLMFAPPGADSEVSDGQAIYQRYWEQARTQVDALAVGLGGLHHIYHESLVEGGEEGLAYLQMADAHAYAMVQVRCQAGATLEATESIELLLETMDLQRCLMVPLASETVAARIQEWYAEANRSRYDYIAQRIRDTLQADETGLLLINERHQVQFPTDLEVFYIAPPALDEYRRWVHNWADRQQRAAAEAMAQGDDADGDGVEEEGAG